MVVTLPNAVKDFFNKERKKPNGVTARGVMAHFSLWGFCSEKTLQRRFADWLGEGGGSYVRKPAANGSMNRVQRFLNKLF